MNSWFALYVQSRHERTVQAALTAKGFEICLPLVRKPHKWCDRTKIVEVPTFPGYVFCNLDTERASAVLSTPGVVCIVGAGRNPVAIPQHEIDTLKILERTKTTVEDWPYLENGQMVSVTGGAFDGLTGILMDCRKPARVVVSVGILQRSVAVEISRMRVRPVKRHLQPRLRAIA